MQNKEHCPHPQWIPASYEFVNNGHGGELILEKIVCPLCGKMVVFHGLMHQRNKPDEIVTVGIDK